MQQSLAIVIGVKNESQKETLESLGACVCKLFHFVRKLHLVFVMEPDKGTSYSNISASAARILGKDYFDL